MAAPIAMSPPKVERQVNLVIALLETRRPLTLEEIRSRTGYYAQEDARAARQMFERDKADLRALGVPIDTRPPGSFATTDGYIIDRREYEQPDLDLTDDEATALAVARRVLDPDEQRLSLVRLAARSPGARSAGTGPADTVVNVATGPVEAFAEPLTRRQVVRFDYRTADGREAQRRVDPHAIATRNGNWYLIGRDHDRDDIRAFRLDRLVGGFEVLEPPNAFEPRDDLDIAAHLAVPGEALDEVVVELHPDVAWEAEARGGEVLGPDVAADGGHGWPTFVLRDADLHRTAGWLCRLGARARIMSPKPLADEVRDRLEAVLAAHR